MKLKVIRYHSTEDHTLGMLLNITKGVADFNPVFSGLELAVADYKSKSAESLLIDAVKGALGAVYGAENLEVVA